MRADFLRLALRQRKQYLAALLRYGGFDDHALAIEALDLKRTMDPEKVARVYRSVASGTEEASSDLVGKTTDEQVVLSMVYMDARLSVKQSLLMDEGTWEKSIATREDALDVLQEATIMPPMLINIMVRLRLLDTDEANRRIERAILDMTKWIVAGFGAKSENDY